MDELNIYKVEKAFGRYHVLSEIEFECKTGEIIGLFGRNGSGKSTLLKILFGTLKADATDVKINSKPFDPAKNIRNRVVAYLAQENFLPKDLKVRSIISIFFQDGEQQNRIFNDPRIATIENQLVSTLSYGELRYLEILLISNLPHSFLLLDEPFTMIEPLYQDAIKDLLVGIKKDKGIILTDHYYFDVWQITDRNILIKDGKSIEVKNKQALAENGYMKCFR